MPKKLKGGTLWDFSTSILSQNSKKIEGGTLRGIFFPNKKSRNAEKTERGPLVSSGIVCYAEILFGSVPWANRGNLKFCRTILVSSGIKKALTKSHDYSRLFSRTLRFPGLVRGSEEQEHQGSSVALNKNF